MGLLIDFPLKRRAKDHVGPMGLAPASISTREQVAPDNPRLNNKSIKMNELEKELLNLVDESFIAGCCEYKISQDSLEDTENSRMQRIVALEELVVFSPEIQQEGFAGPEAPGRDAKQAKWGDVFVKVEDEYFFLFTIYTAGYVKQQLRCHGEVIRPSSSDVILNGDQLCPADILRAVIKWANLHCRALAGKPISLEEMTVLQTLVCDPGVEISCPAPT